MAARVAVGRRRVRGAFVAALLALAGCSVREPSALRVAVTESGGDLAFSLEEPVRSVSCVLRDFRRAPGDPRAARPVWTARCTAGADCRSAVRWDDASLEPTLRAERLGPTDSGTCYECELAGDTGRGLVRFHVDERGGFEPCRAAMTRRTR
jgi:hypothetical protein